MAASISPFLDLSERIAFGTIAGDGVIRQSDFPGSTTIKQSVKGSKMKMNSNDVEYFADTISMSNDIEKQREAQTIKALLTLIVFSDVELSTVEIEVSDNTFP